MSSRESIFFLYTQYVSYSSKKKIFRSIVFRIKNFYKHVDITPSVWNAKLTETRIFRELSIEIVSSLIELKSSLIQLESSLIQ